MEIKINSFEDVCKYQRVLDEEIGKVRNNGFVPKDRNLQKIVLSAIAECIEFNEETEETHKTWKQKEFKQENKLEELTDIMFFIAQLVNDLGEDYADLDNLYNYELNDALLNLINELSSGDYDSYYIVRKYSDLVVSAGYKKEEVFKEYERKWKINMTRINKDWTLGGK